MLADPKQPNHVNLARASPRCSPVREIPDRAVLSARPSPPPPPPPQRTYQEDFVPTIVPPMDYGHYADHYGPSSVAYEIPRPLLKLGVVTPVTVTHIIKPSDFWLRVLSEDGKKLSEQLQLAYNTRHSRENLHVEVGMYYCAPYGEDRVWHRVKVLGIHQPESKGGVADVHVLLVDYGNTDMIPITHLKSLDLAFMKWPLQAVHCCLNGLGEGKQTWTSYEMAQFQQVAKSSQLNAVFYEPRPDGIYPVDLLNSISYGEEILTVSIVSYLVPSHSSVAPPPGMVDVGEALCNRPEDATDQSPEEVLSHNIVKDESSEDENLEYYSDTSDTYVELNDYNIVVPPPVAKPSDGYLLGMVSVVIDPSEIYMHLITPNSNQLDDLREQMATYYNSEASRDVLPVSAVQKGSFWACRYSADNCWYRARVVEMQDEKATAKSKVTIQYIDFGNKEEVGTKELRPLTAEFAKLPAFAIRCSLAYLKPRRDEEGEATGNWSKGVSGRIAQLIEHEKLVTAQPVSDLENCDLWESSIEVLLWDAEDSNDVLLNKLFVRKGLCDTDMKEWLEDEDAATKDEVRENDEEEEEEDEEDDEAKAAKETEITSPTTGLFEKSGENSFGLKFSLKDRLSPLADMDALLDTWNPMDEDYFSERNNYSVDDEDPSVAALGYKLKEDTKVCHYYSIRMSCPRGDNCPFLHVFTGNGLPPSKGEEISVGTNAKLPKPGGLFLVKVTSVVNPGHFYVKFPYGLIHVEDLFHSGQLSCLLRNSEDNSLPSLANEQIDLKKVIHSMGKRYSKLSAREDPATLPAQGALVAAKNPLDGHWFRGRVLDHDDAKPDFCVNVFCLDTGQTHWVQRKDIFKIHPEYLHVPFQAVECFLANIEPKGYETGTRWTKEAKETFQDMVLDKSLVARILKREEDTLCIDLLDIEGQQEFAVSGHLVTMGFAQFSRAMICIPPPDSSSASSSSAAAAAKSESEK